MVNPLKEAQDQLYKLQDHYDKKLDLILERIEALHKAIKPEV